MSRVRINIAAPNFRWKLTRVAVSIGLFTAASCLLTAPASAKSLEIAPSKIQENSKSGRVQTETRSADRQDSSNRWTGWLLSDEFIPTIMMRKFGSLWDDMHSFPMSRELAFAGPRMETSEVGDLLKVRVEVPGYEKSELNIELNDNGFTLVGEKKLESPDAGDAQSKKQMAERCTQRFEQRMEFPYKVDLEKADAQLKNGVLTITVPKSQLASAPIKKLEIQTQ
ncbi:Hsp20/alpha crystallin family protein [Candidatus Obscuribacterales bacterium]|nr:Hsp20/alpha crystallin family protein [Candidatus Obscuribacterales bacterium]